jgi:hypothetical protein
MSRAPTDSVQSIWDAEQAGNPDELLWDIPCAPNAGTWNLAERTVGGYALLAMGVGSRLMIMSKESFAVLHVSGEMPSRVLSVAWSSAGSLRRKPSKIASNAEGESAVSYGVVAAGCMTSVHLFVAEGASFRAAFPFKWSPLVTLTYGPQQIWQVGSQGRTTAWLGMHLTVRSQRGLVAAATPAGLYVWKILDSSSAGSELQTELPVWEARNDDGAHAVVHASFSSDCNVLAWALEDSHDIRLIVLPFPEKPAAGTDIDDDGECAHTPVSRNQDDEAEQEIKTLEERLPECMRRAWSKAQSQNPRARGSALEKSNREWSVYVGAPCTQVAWSNASHFTVVPEIRTLAALRKDNKIMVCAASCFEFVCNVCTYQELFVRYYLRVFIQYTCMYIIICIMRCAYMYVCIYVYTHVHIHPPYMHQCART